MSEKKKYLCTNLEFSGMIFADYILKNQHITVVPAKSDSPEIVHRLFYYADAKFIGEVVYFVDGHIINLVPKLR